MLDRGLMNFKVRFEFLDVDEIEQTDPRHAKLTAAKEAGLIDMRYWVRLSPQPALGFPWPLPSYVDQVEGKVRVSARLGSSMNGFRVPGISAVTALPNRSIEG